jgi:hypothetical protein
VGHVFRVGHGSMQDLLPGGGTRPNGVNATPSQVMGFWLMVSTPAQRPTGVYLDGLDAGVMQPRDTCTTAPRLLPS